MSSNHSRTKGLSSHFVNLKIWRVCILTTTILVVAVAAGYVATGTTPNVIRSVSRTIKGIFDPQVHAKSPQSTLVQLVPVQDPVPTIVTDKTGYLGGEGVGITGTAFGPNEAVTLSVTHADGSAVSEAFGATATADGTFEANWSLPNNSSGHGFVVTALGNTSGASSTATFSRIAIVQTDKYDYQPGETANFTGAGFYANEVVTLQVVHSNGNNFGSGHEPFEATADADGRLTASWFVHPDDSESSIFRLTATGKTSSLTATTTFTDVIISFIDDAGPDDEPGQKDLNAMSSDLGATAIGITWNWDDTGFGPLGGNTGDACTLVDTDQDGFANFAFCVTVDGNPAVKIDNRFYSCNDTRSDRCGGPTLIPAFTTTSTASVVPNSDPFSAHPNHSAGNDCDVDANCLTHDTVANVTLQLSDVGGAANARLLNVCSFPSEEPNSDPSDCVIHPDRGFLTIRKTTETNDNAITAFAFNTSAPSAGGVSNFSANIAGSQTNVVVANQVLFAPGTYNLSEVVPAGWDLATASCTIQSGVPTSTGTFAGNAITGLSIQTGLETICTFTNQKDSNIVVVKQTDPDGDPQSFSFTASYDADGFSLSDGGQNDSGDLDPGSYSVSETVPAGWDLESATCDDGSDPANISLQAGETVTCTFTNEKDANIVVVKETNPDGDTTSFSFTASYDNDGFSLKDGEQNDSLDIDPGTYSVSETVPAGWDLDSATCSDGSDPANISLQAGETVTCTFTNEKDANIVVVKETNPDGDTTSFSFTASYDNDGFSLKDGEQNDSLDIDPGTYSVSETVPSGWDLDSATCDDGSDPASISLQAGETVTCTFTNEKDAKIIVVKQTDPDGDPQSFSFTASYDNDGFSLSDGGQNDSGDIDPGTYSVSETVPYGWDLESATCDDGSDPASISLQAGETVTCTFTNEKDAKIIVVKQTDPDGDPQSFSFTASYDADGFSLIDGGQNNSGDLDPGTYSVSETVPSGWDLTSSPCVSSKGNSETAGSISLQAGETVTCTFYNQKDANIVVIKQTDPDGDTQSFSFTASYDADGFSLKDGEQNDSLDLNPGTYSVSETVPAGWDLTSSPCISSKGNSETAGSISLQAGETVTCTFNNRKRGLVEVLKITNGAANPQLDIRFTLYRDGPDADPDLTGTDVQLETLTTLGDADGLLKFAEKLVPGTTYTICENPVPAGWTSLWTIGFSVGGNITTPYNPNANDAIPSDVGIRCVDFTVNPGQTKQFEVHNDFPGGDPRTIGYWKNWNRCTGGGQAANAAKNGGAAAGFFIIEDLLPQLIGDFNVVNCLQAIKVLSKQDQAAKSKSSDAAYELAAQFLAARFNLAAGAETCGAVQTAVVSAQNLLDQINFTGSGDYLTSKQKNLATQRALALSLATTLDRYNNGILCP